MLEEADDDGEHANEGGKGDNEDVPEAEDAKYEGKREKKQRSSKVFE